jgi:hypothetical protein
MSASAIMTKVLPPVRYVVEGYIAEGVTVLAGRPKSGKSWLALGIGVGVSMGGYALNTRVEQGDVLYLALEDNERRMQKRLKQLLPPSSTTPSRLFIDFTCPRMDQGGLDAIREWVASVEKPRLIVIDVFGKIRPIPTRNEQIYSSDYDSITPLKEIASEHGIAMILVHHTRKQDAEDPFDTVSGSTGLTGAADTVLVLARNSQGTTLYGRGRDIEELETAMSFDRKTGHWGVLGAASEIRRSDERSAVLVALKDAEEPMTPGEIASAIGQRPNNVKQLLFKMVKDGQVAKLHGRGHYVHPDRKDVSDTPEKPRNFDNSITSDHEAIEEAI